MPFINLIAEQREQRRVRIKRAKGWFLGFVGSAVLGVVGFGFLFLRSEALASEVRDLEAQAEALKPFKDAIETNQQLLAALMPRMETLNAARLDTERWSRILDHVGRVMPANTWLTNVIAQQGNDATRPVEIAWTGMSTEQNLVGDLMLALQRSPDLQNLNLKYTETKNSSYGVGLEFQISSEVTGTEESSPGFKKEALKS